MNKVWNLILLLLCICSSAKCVQLENLCSADRFDYKKLDVNSFYRIRQQITFDPINNYLVSDSVKCNPEDFKNHTNYLQAQRLRDEYNHMMTSMVFSEGYLTKCSYDDVYKIFWDLDKITLAMWKLKFNESGIRGPQIDCLVAQDEAIRRGQHFVWIISYFAWESFPPRNHSYVQLLNDLINGLKIEGAKQICIFPFTFMPVQEMAKQPIIRKVEVTFGNDPERRPVLTYDIFLPFHRKDYRYSDPCVPRDQLPLFLAQKQLLDPKN